MLKNQKLFDSMYLLYNRFVELIQKDTNSLKHHVWTIGQWGEDGMSFSAKEFPQWDLLVYEFKNHLQNIPEWLKVLSEIKKDSIIMKHIGKSAGNPTVTRLINLEELIQHFLSSALNVYNGSIADCDTFKEIYEKFEDFFYSDEISVTCRVILDNFKITDIEALNFDDQIFIRKLDIEDINKLYRELFYDRNSDLFRPDSCYEASIKFKTIKVLYGHDSKALDAFRDPNYQKVQSDIEKTILAIKLAVGGGLRRWLTLFEHHAWGYGEGYGSYTIPERMGMKKYSIVKPEDMPLIYELWSAIKNEDFKKDLALQVALRRLVFSLDRDRYDDKLIDTMIGFEALLFKDINEDYKGELRYRFSHRAAFFLEDEPLKRERKFMLMRKAYDLRSNLVHGGNPKDIIKIQGAEYNIKDFILLIQEELRRAVVKYLKLPANKRPHTSEQWNKILFGTA